MDSAILTPSGEELLEKGKSTVSNAVQTAVSDVSNSLQGQVGIKTEPIAVSNQNQSQASPSSGQPSEASQAALETQRTREMVEDFYSPSDNTPKVSAENFEEAQRQEKLAQVRQEISAHKRQHDEVYYNEIAATGTPAHREERPAEKVERQQLEELRVNEQKKQVEVPNAVKFGKTHVEAHPGTVG